MSETSDLDRLRDDNFELVKQLKSTRQELRELKQSTSWKIGTITTRFLKFPLLLWQSRRQHMASQVEITQWTPSLQGVVKFSDSRTRSCHVVVEVEGLDVADLTISSDSPSSTKFEIHYPLSLDIPSWNDLRVRHSMSNLDLSAKLTISPPTRLERAVATLLCEGERLTQLKDKVANLSGRTVAIVSTFRPLDRTEESLLHYLKSLRESDISTIVIDTSEDVSPEEEEIIQSSCDVYLRRINKGWDFSSWLSFITLFPELEQVAGRLILTNDSNYGPIYSISEFLSKNSEKVRDFDLWGITESLQHSRHIQSYFMVLERRALDKQLLTSFARKYTFPTIKSDVIYEGELAFTRHAYSKRLNIGAVISYRSVQDLFSKLYFERAQAITNLPAAKLRTEFQTDTVPNELLELIQTLEDLDGRKTFNPTHTFWEEVILLGSPFLKRELLTSNPTLQFRLFERAKQLTPLEVFSHISKELFIQ